MRRPAGSGSRSRDVAALEDVRVLVDGDEQVARTLDRFGRAEEQVAARVQREVEHLQHPLLRGAIEVDEQVAARHQIEMRERRILDHVVVREQHHLAQLLAHAVGVALLAEEAAQPLRRHVGGVVQRVEALARACDRAPRRCRWRRSARRAHRPGRPACSASSMAMRIRLLAGGAARRPRRGPDRSRPRSRKQLWDRSGVRERLERLAVAEEVRDADQQVPEQRLRLVRLLAQVVRVGGQIEQIWRTPMRRSIRRSTVARL